ncbi:unnamed protein product [Rotaria sp. Silwood2]|nr:unnamed protein product [Rotaria sp. Silwood2]
MSRKTLASNGNNGVDASFLSSNHKVMQYLQNSARCSTNSNNNSNNCNNNNLLFGQHKTSAQTHDLFYVKGTSMNNNYNHHQYPHRIRSCSKNSSEPSTIDTQPQFNCSFGSNLPGTGRHCSTFDSTISSFGICSTLSDVGHEEEASTSSVDLDFNLGFDQISDNDDIEIANLDEIDEYSQNEEDNQQISNKNNGNTATSLDFGESNSDARNNELERFLRKSYSSTTLNGNIEFNNDDTITDKQIRQQQQRASLLHDSTYTLCSPDRFSVYSENNDHEKYKASYIIGRRFNSLGVALLDRKSAILDKPTKKIVRFADMLGLDLESIRYMTPPDQSANSLIQECIRNKLEQLCVVKTQLNLLSISPCRFDLSNFFKRSSSSASFNASKKLTNQYYLVSKYFTYKTNMIPLIYEQQVMLECLYTKDSTAYGTVRVHNRAYEKRVFARISENDWKTFEDIYGWHSMNYPNDNTDALKGLNLVLKILITTSNE